MAAALPALIGVLLVIGTIGKSAQFPLHTWLPDAMEGPTPVSAMIHAAAMVSAGVYMVVRMFPLLSAGADFHHYDYSTPMVLMGLIGAITALGAAMLAVGQNDIKRVLAYSTISQLGYMIAALGIGAWVAAAFHLINHAFFKALLFMASGSVIHAMEHGEHHAAEHGHGHAQHEEPDGLVMDYCAPPNDIQRMGGLLHRIPVTAITMALGGLSLAGFPLITAGFWSKDEIIAEAWHGMTHDPVPAVRAAGAGGGGLPDGVLHRAHVVADLLGPAAHRGGGIRQPGHASASSGWCGGTSAVGTKTSS